MFVLLEYWTPSRVFAHINFTVPGVSAVHFVRASKTNAHPNLTNKLSVYNLSGQDRLLAYARHTYELERAEQKIRLASAEPIEKDVREALVESAISIYISCFNSKISKLPVDKIFRNTPTLKSFHKLINELRNKVVDHGDLTYHAGHVAVALDLDSRVEYLDVFYSTVGEWLNTRDITKFFVLVHHVKKWAKKRLEEERQCLERRYKGEVLDKNYEVGPIVVADAYRMLSALRGASLRKLYQEADIDNTDTDIQVFTEKENASADASGRESISFRRFDSGPQVNIDWSTAKK